SGEPRIYNLTDDEPCAPHMVTQYGAGLLSVEVPPLIPFEGAELSAMAKSFYAENKQVSNALMKEHLIKPLYPTYKEGLRAIFEAGAF
ncbi:MAG: NAD(P)-dependent oxidoreductase, partial [Parvibaculales bacterium]